MIKDSLKVALADAVAFKIKAQFYHWNVEGPDFKEYHDLFGEIYSEVDGSIDTIAELIRTLDVYAPGTLSRFQALTTVTEDETIPGAVEMARRLYVENLKVIATLMQAYKDAEDESELGVSNFLQDRIQAHQKHSWMLKATTKQ